MRPPAALLHPRELTSRWLTAALDRGGIRADVAAFRWRRIGQDTGIGGFVTRVELRYRGALPADAPASVVIKFPRWRQANSLLGAHEEQQFYRDHAESCPVGTPRFYFGAHNRRARLWTLVIEDLRRYRALDDVVGVGADDVPITVAGLARLHAWGRGRTSMDWVESANAEAYIEPARAWYEGNVDRGLRRLRGFIPTGELARFRDLGNHVTAAHWLLSAEPQTVSHADYRGDNLFIAANRQLVVIDWESLVRNRGGYDLGRLLGTSVEPDVLRRDGQAFIDLYARTVLESGFTDYKKADIERDVRLGIVGLMVESVAKMPSPMLGRGRPLRVVRTWAIRASAAVKQFDAFDAFPADALRAAAESNGSG